MPSPLRVRLAKICGRRLFCSCEYFCCIDLPCRRIMCILTAICPEYKGVTHCDVSVVWWSIYSLCGYSKSNNNERFHEVSTLCESLQNHDVDGPLLPLSNKLADINSRSILLSVIALITASQQSYRQRQKQDLATMLK
jgi:hypothetical protein